MTFSQIFHFILKELSAGNLLQNIGVYTLLVLLAWIVIIQFKQQDAKYRTR
ncbi:hypothetical protein [Mucilaginibacter gotjawali]|uniref:Uncharacterized protein n=2 Tax=Mucilaginibacter gotjawali TaxID=1550579 RepID=A0A110B1W3_9SPHI|nr:hypothetical protein [Mucilaginibacter gotjawali]MBB3057229.1 hypothetical protein [Mucilaginibacter gotjawali]BAU53003.1 hypothetical protein MgSA37_01170 [Mucilaginibacter gotjawali]